MKRIAIIVAAVAVAGTLVACGHPEPRARTVSEFADEPAVAQGMVARCDADKRLAKDPECANARAAIERIGKPSDTKYTSGDDAEFERQRELRRARDEAAKRAAAAANPPFDPYSSPVTADPAQAPSPPKP